MRVPSMRIVGNVLAVACCAVVLGGCSGNPEPKVATTPAKAVALAGPQVDTTPLRYKHYDFAPAKTPEELAAADYIQVTAIGTVEKFLEGPTYITEPNNSPYPRVYMVVKVDKAFKGAVKHGSAIQENRLYIEFDRGPINTLDGKTPLIPMSDFEKGIPAGTRVAVFATNAPKISKQLVNTERTAPVKTFSPHPQGLMFEDPGRAGNRRMVPGLIEYGQLPPVWQNIPNLDELAARMSTVND